MTEVESAVSGLGAYREVLRIPGAARFSASGAIARLPLAMIGLGAVLMLSGLDRSYSLAGVVAGTIAVFQGLAGPRIGRLADRIGQSKVMLPQVVVHVGALIAIVAAALAKAPAPLLVVLGAVVGASLPQVGAFSRARWATLLADDARVNTGLAVESLIDEVVFIVGPVLVTFLATAIAPAAGLIVACAVTAIGATLFLAQRSTEPRPHPHADDAAVPARAMAHTGLIVLVGSFVGIGCLFGLIEVSVVALTRERHHAGVAGLMLGLWATGSLFAGIAYGAIRWKHSTGRRYVLSAVALTAGALLVALTAGSLVITTLALMVAGLANAPILISGNTLVPDVVAPHAVTEAYTWLAVAIVAGAAIGSPIGGLLVDHVGGRSTLWAAPVAAGLCLAVAFVGRRWLTPVAADARSAEQ
ncbi:MAG: putative arabinose efflux permease, family [Ilumatobacteraceae bacterium]|nr:putative arabinose efflux permease, family [Ilumatobacteraceae bacterium]